MFNNYNPYYNYMQPQIPRVDPRYYQNMQNQQQPIYNQPQGLQGKSVDSVEVVKAMDIPLDGSISYFPILDGSAIVTKQLQQDGTSKTIIYKPADGEKEPEQPKWITQEQMDEAMKSQVNDLKQLREEVKNVRRQLRTLQDLKED